MQSSAVALSVLAIQHRCVRRPRRCEKRSSSYCAWGHDACDGHLVTHEFKPMPLCAALLRRLYETEVRKPR